MLSTKILFGGVTITIFLFFYGCSLPTYLLLYNNTSDEIILTTTRTARMKTNDNKLIIKKGEKSKIIFPDKLQMKILKQNKIFRYNFVWPPKDYIGGSIESKIFFQIEADGKIYVLKSGTFPAKKFPKQPKGYPLVPIPVDNKD